MDPEPSFSDWETWAAITDLETAHLAETFIRQLATSDFLEIKSQKTNLVSLILTQVGESYLDEHNKAAKEQERPLRDVPIYLQSVSLKNTRCFSSEQSLDLTDKQGAPARWTVLLGENGVGKTTVLQAIAALFPTASVRNRRSTISATWTGMHLLDQFEIDFIRDTDQVTGVELYFRPGPLTSNTSERMISSRVSGRSHDAVLTQILMFGGWAKTSFLSDSIFAMGGSEDIGRPPLIVGYGATRYSTRTGDESSSSAVASLFAPTIPLRSAEDWLLKADYASRFEGEHSELSLRRLEKVKRSIIKILPGVQEIEFVAPTDERPEPSVRFKTHFGNIPYKSMSLGYQSTLAWVADLCARLFEHYPDSADPLREPAVVLVDEIDLHLHPKWQRQIMSFLSGIFENVQFIATTHSPLIVQGIENVNLALLKRSGSEVRIENDIEAVRSWRADQLLTSDLFDLESARPPYVEKLLKEKRSILTKAAISPKDEARLSRIGAQLGEIPTAESPQEQEAMDIIVRAAARLGGRGTEE